MLLASLVRFSLTQRLLVLLGVALLIPAGWWAFRSIPIDAFPDISPTQVKVIMKAPGMTPEEVEQRVQQLLDAEDPETAVTAPLSAVSRSSPTRSSAIASSPQVSA